MKTLKRWCSIIGSAALSIALAGCGGGGDSSASTVSVRLINATLTHPSLDLLVGGTTSITATAVDTVSAYITPASGANTLAVANTGTTAALATIVPSLTAGNAYALLSYESGGTVKMAVLNESIAAPSSGAATLRIYNAAIEAGQLDVYVLSTGVCSDLSSFTANTSFGVLTAPAAVTITTSPGTYQVCVTGSGNKSDLRLQVSGVTLTNQQVGYVILTPASGGQLLDGAFMVQQNAYTAARNTSTRVRVAAAVSGSATVAASASSAGSVAVIDGGSVAPAFGYYTLVPANSTLNISVNGLPVSAPATALKAGADMTLLVYGPAGSPIASLLTDDNRAPASNSVKLRLINGITTSPGAISLAANNAPVASNVLAGTASGYVSVTLPQSSNTFAMVLTSSAVGGTYASTSTQLNGGTVYTVLAADTVPPVAPPNAAQFLIR